MNKILDINKPHLRNDLPEIKVGEKVEVSIKNFNENGKEKDKFRMTHFKGTVISQKNRGQFNYVFSVLKESSKVGIKGIFLYHSPLIHSIKKVGKINEKIRRAKLNYLERALTKKKDNE